MAKNDLARRAQEMTAGLFGPSLPELQGGADQEERRGGADQEERQAARKERSKGSQAGSGRTYAGKKVVYSARIDSDVCDMWADYVKAKGKGKGELLEAALMEYMKRHALAGKQKELFQIQVWAPGHDSPSQKVCVCWYA